MPVFKCFLRIVKKNLPSLSVYVIIFIALAILLSSAADSDEKLSFSSSSVNVTVINRDDSELGNSIKDYLSTIHNIVDLPDDKEQLQDELFYRNTEYILIIPKGFEQSVKSGDLDIELENIKVPDSTSGSYVDLQIDQYLSQINIYLKSGFTLDQAVEYTETALNEEAEVEIADGYSDGTKPIYYYYQYLAYILITVLIVALSPILMVFNQKEILNRNEVSSFKLKQKNLQLIAGTVICALIVWLLFTVAAMILYKDDFFTTNVLYCIINSLALLAVSASIPFLVGVLVKSSAIVQVISNVAGLGMAFLCGVFVPQEVMSSSVLAFSKFLPPYWYVKVNNILAETTNLDSAAMNSIIQGILIQLGFVVAIIAVALVLSKYKKLHPSN